MKFKNKVSLQWYNTIDNDRIETIPTAQHIIYLLYIIIYVQTTLFMKNTMDGKIFKFF